MNAPYRYKTRVGLVIAAVLVFAAGGSAVAHESPFDGPRITVTSVGGQAVGDGRHVVFGDGFAILPNTIYRDGGYEDPAGEEDAILVALGSVDHLRAWALCAQELEAEAKLRRGYIQAVMDYPVDRPFTPSEHTRQFDHDQTATAARKAVLYERAADLARAAAIACVGSGPLDVGHYTTLTITGETGVRRQLDVPDYAVVRSLVEYMALTKQCESQLAQRITRLEHRPIDAEVNFEAPYITFSEREKATALTRLRVEQDLARSQQIAC